MKKQVSYTVKGHWPFPLDMLRHDQSHAATSEDQELIDLLSGDHAHDREAFVDVEITLAGVNKPNTARWESFGWSVPADTEHAFFKAARDRARREQATFDAALAKLSPDEQKVVLERTKFLH